MEKNQLLNRIKNKEVTSREIIMYSLGFFAYSIINLGFSTYLTFFWSDILIIPLGAISIIFLLSRIFDGITDIIIGFLVDKTKTKYGKARPWLLWTAIPSAISFALMYYVPNLGETGRIAWALITYNIVALVFITGAYLPLQSLTSLITEDSKKRLTINMVAQGFATLATILGNMYVARSIEYFGGGAQGYFRFFGLMGVLASTLMLVAFFGTEERVQSQKSTPTEKVSAKVTLKAFVANKWWILVTLLMALTYFYPALMAINVYYMKWNMGNPALMGPFMSIIYGAMLATLILITPVINKVGKIKAGFIGMFVQVMGGILPLFAPASITLLMVSAALRGIGPAILLGTRLAFMCDVIEYGEWKTGIRLEGIIFSGASFGAKVGTGIGAAVVSVMLAYGGYVGGAAVQTAAALSAIEFTFIWLHALSSVLVTICLFFLRGLEKDMPKILADLKVRNGK